MKKVAVFGNAGAGKSTTSKKLAEYTDLPLYVLDKVQFLPGGREVSHEEYQFSHNQLLANKSWIIEGFGNLESTWARLAKADTLVYLDLPIYQHALWVTKRFCKGLLSPPEGWPKKTPLIKATLNSYRTLWLCHRRLTPQYRQYVADNETTKTVHHLRSRRDIAAFLTSIKSLEGK